MGLLLLFFSLTPLPSPHLTYGGRLVFIGSYASQELRFGICCGLVRGLFYGLQEVRFELRYLVKISRFRMKGLLER